MTRPALLFFLAIAPALHAGPELMPPGTTKGQDEWRPLFAAMAEKGAVRSGFTERRWLAVRPEPIELKGELRFSPDHGLSLHYSDPEDQTVVVDDRGIVVRDARGRTRAMKSGSRATAVVQTLLPVMRFDFDKLLDEFDVAATRTGEEWTIKLTPHDTVLQRSLGVLRITGSDESIERLEFRRSEKQRIEITVDATDTGVTFSEEEMKRYFR